MSDITAIWIGLAATALVCAAAVGWVLNVIKVFAGLADPLTGMFLFRCLSIFIWPIGCIVGWL